MALHIHIGEEATVLQFDWLDAPTEPPVSLVAAELILFVQLSRIATRERICPLEVRALRPPDPQPDYPEYFGVPVQQGPRPALTFAASDAACPFPTANDHMWHFFDPDLQRRLSELDETATASDRLRAALLELLPGEGASVGSVSRKLNVSPMTLQRRLSQEGHSFQALPDGTRGDLAKHHLRTSDLSGAEIAFFLSFAEPSSFFRAFPDRTGQTREQVRGTAHGGH